MVRCAARNIGKDIECVAFIMVWIEELIDDATFQFSIFHFLS